MACLIPPSYDLDILGIGVPIRRLAVEHLGYYYAEGEIDKNLAQSITGEKNHQ